MKNFNRISFALLLLVMMISAQTQGSRQPAKLQLSVLYVGYNPEKPMPQGKDFVHYMPSGERYAEIYKNRMGDFRRFLERNFRKAFAVDVRDYQPAMSDQYDVTIIDAGPLKLPAGFSRAAILMSAMAPNIGLPLGLKFDWYCQCLDDEALNLRTSHEIFNSPNKVQLTMVDKPTPESFFNGFQGAGIAKTMLRWKVVTEGFSSNTKYLIGMVSHGEGFDDSPDAEVISGGVCLKNAEAVAIGRQGNFLMWGFSGSPDFMTREAQQVFVNSICYIKKFDRQPPIVMKVQIETRHGIDEKIFRLDKELFDKAIASRIEGNLRMKKLQQELIDKKAKGEDIGYNNEMFLKMPVTDQTQSFEDYIRMYATPELFKAFGTNIPLYHKYYRDNYEYFYPLDSYNLQLDQDAQQLGISNRNPEILEKAIQLMESNKDKEMGQRLLSRYTKEQFSRAADWRKWFNKNRKQLFYTEAGGFKFMVNTYGRNSSKPEHPVTTAGSSTAAAPGKPAKGSVQMSPAGTPATSGRANATTISAATPAANTASANTASAPSKVATVLEINTRAELPTAEDPVSVSASLKYSQDKKTATLTINTEILQGWHIYAYVSKDNPFIQTETILELPAGVSKKKDWESTAPIPYPGLEGVFVFEGKSSFNAILNMEKAKAGDVINCGLSYQSCDETKCLQPTTKTIRLTLL